MRVAAPDFARRVTLPGVGPCPRPVDLDQASTGHKTLVSLRIYSFAQGMTIDGEAEADEVFITLMRGDAAVTVTAGDRRSEDALGATAGPRVLYMPPDAHYQLQAVTDCDVAYARVRPRDAAPPPPRAFGPDGGRLEVAGYATAMDLALARFAGGDAIAIDRGNERLVHLRSDDGSTGAAGDVRIGDWDTLVLAEHDGIDLRFGGGTADVLSIGAATG